MRYWQHDETGRVATSDDDVDLSPRYYEISKEAYEAHEAAQQSVQPDKCQECGTKLYLLDQQRPVCGEGFLSSLHRAGDLLE